MSELIYIVPHDFTTVADKAAKQALKVAKRSKGEVMLLHITKSKKDVASAEEKLRERAAGYEEAKEAKLTVLARSGSIFSDIGKVANEKKAHMVVMGTHGAKGMQKVFGSFAVKVIRSTHIPFMIVQEGDYVEEFTDIVFGIDINVESLQILDAAKFMAKAFGAKIHMVGEKHKDKGKAGKIVNRIKLVLKQFKEADINYEADLLDGEGGYANKLVEYGEKVGASIFAVTHDSTKLLSTLDSFTQSMITNKMGRPTLIINAQEVSNAYF